MNLIKEQDKRQVAAIVLAAGSSRRLGTPKQLIQFNGKSLLQHTVQQVLEAGLGEVLLVTGFQSVEIGRETTELPIRTFCYHDWEKGQGASLSAGIEQLLEQNPDLDGVLVTLCDQPFLNPEHIKQLIDTFQPRQHMIVASGYSDTFGVPILVDRCYFEELLQLKGDEGGKKVLTKHKRFIKVIPFPKGAIDIDEAEDLRHL